MAFNVNHLLADPMANMALNYGSSIASQGKDMVHKEVWPAPRARVAGCLAWARAGHRVPTKHCCSREDLLPAQDSRCILSTACSLLSS